MKHITGFIAAGLLVAFVATPAVAGKKAEPWKSYGAGITLKKPAPLAKVAPGTEVLVRAKITEVCQNKGCWMTVADGKQTMRVEFKDYGFFVPYDSEGKSIHLQGVVADKVMSPEEQAHIAAESKAGDAKNVSDQPKKMRVFVASGVAIQGGSEIGDLQRAKIGAAKAVDPHHGHDHGAPGHKH